MGYSREPFQITFWRSIHWERRLLDGKEGGLAEQERFLEEIYTWSPASSIWDVIIDKDVTEQLRASLLEGFSPDKLPSERKIEHFRGILEDIEKIIKSKQTDWGKINQPIDNGEDDVLSANSVLSFLHHLTWLCNIFADVPEISITIY
jgi:hypothetical protein